MNINSTGFSSASSSNERVHSTSKKSHKVKENKLSNDTQKSKISSIQKDTLSNQSHEKSVALGKRSKVEVKLKKSKVTQSKENGHKLENKARREEKFRVENPIPVSEEASDDVQLLKLLELDRIAIVAINELLNPEDRRLANIVTSIVNRESEYCCNLIDSIHEPILPIDQNYLIELADKYELKEVENSLWNHQINYPYIKPTVNRRTNANIDNKIIDTNKLINKKSKK